MSGQRPAFEAFRHARRRPEATPIDRAGAPRYSAADRPRKARSLKPSAADRPGSLGAIFRNASWLLGGKGVGAVLSLVYLGMATRTLGPARFGEFMLILGLGQTIAAFATFQSWQIVIQYGMDHLRHGRTQALDRLTLFCSALDVGSAVIGGLGAAAGVALIAPRMGWSPELSRHALIFCLVLLFSLRSAPTGLLRLHDRYAAGSLAETMTPFVRLVGAIAAVAAGASVSGFLAAWAVAEVLTGVAFWWGAIAAAGFPWRPSRWPTLAGVRHENEGLWRYSLVTNVIGSLAVSGKQLSTVLVGLYVSPGAAGAYRLCYQLSTAVAKASQMISRALFPELVRAQSGSGRAALAALFRQTTLISAGAGAVLLALIWAAGRPLLGLIAGAAYRDNDVLLHLIGTAAVLDLVGIGFEPALFSTRRERSAFLYRSLSTALLIVLMIVLMPRYGVIGAGVACLVNSAVAFVALGWAAWRAVHEADDPAVTAHQVAAAGEPTLE